MQIRLDLTTLTLAQHTALIDALLAISALNSGGGRADLLNDIRQASGRWIDDVPDRGNTPRDRVIAIWSTASERSALPQLLDAIAAREGETAEVQRVRQLVHDLTAFVEVNDPLYEHLRPLLDAIGGAPRPVVARWIAHVRSRAEIHVAPGTLEATSWPRDTLLVLGDYSREPDGDYFPLFTVVEGIAGDILDGPALSRVRNILDAIAARRKLTGAQIAKLRQDVEAVRRRLSIGDEEAPAGEPSVLVLIEPDPESTSPPRYFLRVYDWLPWESSDTARAMRSSGRAVNPSDALPAQARDALLAKDGTSPIATAVAARLLSTPMTDPFVEFVVPGTLVGEAFDAIVVDAGTGGVSIPVPLGSLGRVVVRPLERWDPHFQADMKALVEQWRHRWVSIATMTQSLRAWYWKTGVAEHAAIAALARAEHRDVGCVAVAFAPTDPRRLHAVMMRVGAPVALWIRSTSADAEATLKKILDGKAPPDLRDRVQNARAETDQETTDITLLWDDPNRPPRPVDAPGKDH